MKTNKLLLFFLLLTSVTGFCATITITSTSSSMVFSPNNVTIDFGDVVNFDLASIHNAVEVDETTYNEFGSTALLNGFRVPFGGGSITDLSVGTHWYICENHVSMGMRGIITVASLGLNEYYLSKNFSIFPNPTTSFINIKTNENIFDLPYCILDIQGRQVVRGKLENITTSVNLSQLNSGIYFFQIGGVKRQTLKLIKK